MKAIAEAIKKFHEVNSRTCQGPRKAIHAQIVKRVLDGLDQKDRAIARATKDFLNAYCENLEEKEERKILKEISSEEIIAAIVQVHQATIELMACDFRMKIVEKKISLSSENFNLKVLESEFLEDIDWAVDPFKLVIVEDSQADKAASWQKAIEFVRALADGSAPIPLGSVCNGNLPENIRQVAAHLRRHKVQEFFIDIAELIAENGENGRRLVLQICENVQVAEQAIRDAGTPGPLKLLASTVLKFIKKPN